MRVLLPFAIAVQFLTKLPIRLPRIPTPQENAYSVLYYPLVGLLIGGILYAVSGLAFGVMAKAAVLTVLWVYLTGGLHLDGLADMADGFVGGYGDKDRTLAIMKDPHIGAMGVLAIAGALLLKFGLVAEILSHDNAPLFIIAPIVGRLAILFLLLTTPYVRKNGLGLALSEHLPRRLTKVVLALSLLVVFVLPIQIALLMLLVFFGLSYYFKCWFCQRIGGITGDTLGASVEMMEIAVLFVGCFMNYY